MNWFGHLLLVEAIYLSKGQAEPENSINFSIFAQLSPSQKYIYTWSLQNFLGVLKSYESESFISAGLSPVAQDYDTPWHPSFVGILENSQIPTCTALPIVTLLQPKSTHDAGLSSIPHAAGEEFCPMCHRPESFRTILCGTIFLSSVKVATGSRRRRAGHADL